MALKEQGSGVPEHVDGRLEGRRKAYPSPPGDKRSGVIREKIAQRWPRWGTGRAIPNTSALIRGWARNQNAVFCPQRQHLWDVVVPVEASTRRRCMKRGLQLVQRRDVSGLCLGSGLGHGRCRKQWGEADNGSEPQQSDSHRFFVDVCFFHF